MNFLVLANSEHCWSYHGLALSPPHGPDSDTLDFLKNLNFFGDNFKFTSLHKSLKFFWLEHVHALHKFRENYQVIKMYEQCIDRWSSSKHKTPIKNLSWVNICRYKAPVSTASSNDNAWTRRKFSANIYVALRYCLCFDFKIRYATVAILCGLSK